MKTSKSFNVDLSKYIFPSENQCYHDYVWLAYPTGEEESYAVGYNVKIAMVELIKILVEYVHIRLIVSSEGEKREVDRFLKLANIRISKIEIFIIPHPEIFMRDMGPFFIVPKNGKGGLKMLHFGSSNWGYHNSLESDIDGTDDEKAVEKVRRLIGKKLEADVIKAKPFIVSEGGDKSFSGNGILMITRTCEFKNRNPELTESELKKIYKYYYGQRKVIMLEYGLVEDDHPFYGRKYNGEEYVYNVYGTTNGHNDECVRFINKNTILMSYFEDEEIENSYNPIILENHRRMKKNLEILEDEETLDGGKFEIIKFPMAELMYVEVGPGDRVYELLIFLEYKDDHTFPFGENIKVVLPASYMNYFVTNGVVVVPQFYSKNFEGTNSEVIRKKDKLARNTLKRLFPNRQIVGFNPIPFLLAGGGPNCVTMQQPSVSCIKDLKDIKRGKRR